MDNRSVLIDRLVTLFIDNITEEISPQDARDVIQPIIESCLNLIDDKALMNLRALTVRPYDVGECYVHSGSIYQVTVAHTGGGSPDLSKTTIIFSPSNLTISDWVSGAVVNTNQLFYYNGSIIRRTGGTITSYNPNGEGGWKFLNGEIVSTNISSAGQNITLDASESQSKAYVLTIQYDLGIEWVNLIRTGIYKLIIFNNTASIKTITLNNGVNKNIYNNEALSSLVIPASTRCIFEVSTDGAQYYYGGKVLSFSSIVIDENYGVTWLGDTTHAPSRTSIYDKIEAVIVDYNNRIDAAIEGVKWKTPVEVLSDDNVNLLDAQTNIDGVDIYEGDSVALPFQTDLTENGIYVLGSDGLLVRSPEADTGDELSIAQFTILQGSHANETWGVNNRTIELGVEPISMSVRNTGTTPEATEFVSGKGKIAQDGEIDALLTGSTSLPLQSNVWISLRGLKRALNWVVGLFYTKGDIDDKFQIGQSISATAAGSVNDYTVVLDDGTTTFGGALPRAFYLKFPTGLLPTGIANINTGAGLTNIWRQDGSTLQPGDIIADTRYLVTLKGSAYVIMTVGLTTGGGGSGVWGTISGTLSDQTDLQAALDGKQNVLGYTAENVANKGANNGYAGLDSTGKVPSSQLPAYVDDVIEFANLAALPVTGETGIIYITLDTNLEYRWSGSVYVNIAKGDVQSVNTKTGAVTLNQDEIPSGTTYVQYSLVEKTKLGQYPATYTNNKWLKGNGVAYVEADFPDASPTVKGVAKLYNSLGTNTDGAMDQASASILIQYNLMINLINSKR
jgi:hypothetical protein